MLGERSDQRGLWEADRLYLDHVGRDTFYGMLASLRGRLFRDAEFAEFYCPDNGRDSVPRTFWLGWGSAGSFHFAETQLARFFNCLGGSVGQVTNYSFGAATVIVPRIVGTMEPVVGAMTSWPTIAEHTKLMVLFGGMSPRNSQVNREGVGRHDLADWLDHVSAAGVQFVNIGPLRDDAGRLDAQWLPIRPNTDAALMLGLMHTLVVENLHDVEFLARYCVGFERFQTYLTWEADGIPKSADWAAQITEV